MRKLVEMYLDNLREAYGTGDFTKIKTILGIQPTDEISPDEVMTRAARKLGIETQEGQAVQDLANQLGRGSNPYEELSLGDLR